MPAWRARTVAEATIHATPALTLEAAGWVDAQVAAVAGRIGPAQLDRLVAETIKRFELAGVDPAADPEDGYLSVDPRHATLNTDDVHYAGTLHFEADLDIADAPRPRPGPGPRRRGPEGPRLHRVASTSAAPRPSATSPAPRPPSTSSQGQPAPRDARTDCPAAREVVLHAHFDATTDGQATVFGPTGRLEEGQRLVLLDQVKAWCGDSRTKVTIKPVIDLNTALEAPGYAIPDRIREHVILRDRTCVFPWCTRPARGCDIDHVIEYDHDADAEGRAQPGPDQRPTTSPRCAGSTTASRPTPPGPTE